MSIFLQDIISAEFIHKLESLLQRAYRLQEEFEATLGASDPASLANDIGEYSYFTFLLLVIMTLVGEVTEISIHGAELYLSVNKQKKNQVLYIIM